MTCCHIQGGEGLIFDQEGSVLPCNHFPSHPLGKFGVDFHDAKSFEKFWHGEEINNFRDITRRYPAEKCTDCSYWDQCGGGCFIEWLAFQPSDYIK